MKRIVLSILILLPPVCTQAQVIISLLLGDKLNSGQVEFGLEGGVNLSDQTGVASGKSKTDFNLGFYFDIKTKSSLLIHTGVIVKSNMGSAGLPVYSLADPNLDNSFVGGTIERNLNYFNVPVLLKKYLAGKFYGEAGIQLGLLYGAHDIFTARPYGSDLTYKVDILDNFNRLDAGGAVGIGYRLMNGEGMNLGVRYYYGFVDIVKDNPGAAVYNSSLYFTVGIPIGAGKARREREGKSENEK